MYNMSYNTPSYGEKNAPAHGRGIYVSELIDNRC